MYKLYQYNDTDFRLLVSKNDYKPHDINTNDVHISNSEISSLSRSRRMIREIALCNSFTYFFTATINSELCDRFSLSETQVKIRKIMKAIKRKNNNFIYLFITERHKDGAFHFHGLCSDIEFYTNSNGYLSNKYFDKLGFNSFSKIKDNHKVSNYITKYITKDCVKNEAGSVYFCSRGLKRSISYEIAPIDFTNSPLKFWSNDYVRICDFSVDCLNSEQLLYLINNIKEKNNFLKDLLKKRATF